ncbi:MAG TPA: hypothetical protein VN704_10515 [Verrucomicrobiae bacterium]|nr:hypothetical protein [Verrucomicrobiae bacterium]
MSNDNNLNNDNSKFNIKKKSLTPTIGDAVKTAVETNKEVQFAGPAEVGDIIHRDKNLINKSDNAGVIANENNVTSDETIDSKLEVNIKESGLEIPSNENRIIVNQEDSTESNVESITTIPTEEGVEVEVLTEVEVPVKDKNKDVESDSKVKIHSHGLSAEIPLSSNYSRGGSTDQKIETPNTFNYTNPNPISESINESINKNRYGYSIDSRNFNTFEKNFEQISRNTINVARNYMDLQCQIINSFQNTIIYSLKNTNHMLMNHQIYCTKMPELFTKIFAENTIALNKIFEHITSMNSNRFKNTFN